MPYVSEVVFVGVCLKLDNASGIIIVIIQKVH